MANHKSSEKRIRQTEARRDSNKYYAKTTRNAIKALRTTTSKEEAANQLPKLTSMLDKLAKKNVIHKYLRVQPFFSARSGLNFAYRNISLTDNFFYHQTLVKKKLTLIKTAYEYISIRFILQL
jgi:small subunit ribosomal protein S20